MALSIKSDEADRLARELARETGESLTDAVTEAIRERLTRERKRRRRVAARLVAIGEKNRDRPRVDARPEHEVLGGRHPAGLDLGDCYAYAAAMRRGDVLLFVGDGFRRTDVRAAIAP